MIIAKAIEILRFFVTEHSYLPNQDTEDATKLGIEALKRIQNGRLHPFNPMYSPLPGESMPERGVKVGLQFTPNKKPQ